MTGKKWKSADSQLFEDEMAGAMNEVGGILGNQMIKMQQRVHDTKEMMKKMVRADEGMGNLSVLLWEGGPLFRFPLVHDRLYA